MDLVVPDSSCFRFFGVGLCLLLDVAIWFLAFLVAYLVILMLFKLVVWSFVIWSSVWTWYFGVVIPFRWISWWLHSGFVLGWALVWSCHLVPMDLSGDCIQVLCWWAPVWCLFGMFWLLCVEHVWISDFIFGFASSSLICCLWGVWVLFVFGIILATSWML